MARRWPRESLVVVVVVAIVRRVARIELVELGDDVAGFGEFAQIDLAVAHEREDDLSELGEHVVAPPRSEHLVEPLASLPRTAFEHLTGRAEERPERASQLGSREPATSLPR